MKTFKSILTLVFVVSIYFTGTAQSKATPATVGNTPMLMAKRPPLSKEKTKAFLKKTTVVIIHAKKQVSEGKNFTGDLSKAITHQKMARSFYKKGMLFKAVHHSKIARDYATKSIKANKGKEIEESKFSLEENELLVNAPTEESLTADITAQNSESITDESIITKENLDIDLAENE